MPQLSLCFPLSALQWASGPSALQSVRAVEFWRDCWRSEGTGDAILTRKYWSVIPDKRASREQSANRSASL
jgi:hypothetical protein